MAKKVKEEKIECLVCGISVTRHNLKRHAKSKKHKDNSKKHHPQKNKVEIVKFQDSTIEKQGIAEKELSGQAPQSNLSRIPHLSRGTNRIKERAKTVPIEIKNKVDEQMKNAKTSFFKRIYNKINTWLNNNGF